MQTWYFLTKTDTIDCVIKSIHKGRVLEINYIKRFHNAKTLEISVGNSYTEDQPMQAFLENIKKRGKYSDHIAIQQVEFRR